VSMSHHISDSISSSVKWHSSEPAFPAALDGFVCLFCFHEKHMNTAEQ
jgi:hypothetical protein